MDISAFFLKYKKVALAFSGGTDSAYLLYEAKRCGADVQPYFVQSQFQPQFEREDAKRLAEELKIPLKILEVDVLSHAEVAANPPNRCYYCKRQIFSVILAAAKADGCDIVIDGTNASDDLNDRPGAKALQEYGVLSPLRLCGITKDELRRRSLEAGLFTGKKPSYACLATRIKTGELITEEKLWRVEQAENLLFEMGYSDFRVRTNQGTAKLQVPADQLKRAFSEETVIREKLREWFPQLTIDPIGR